MTRSHTAQKNRPTRRNPQLNAFLVERRQLSDLRTLVEIAYGKHDARVLARLTARNLGGASGLLRFLREEKWPDETVSEMDRWRNWLREGLKRMFEPDGWKLSTADPMFKPFTVRLHAGNAVRAVYEDITGAAAAGLVAWKLVETHRWRLKQCAWPKCGKIFVTHMASDYCSPQHSQNARTAKYRAKLAGKASGSRRSK